VNRESVLLLGGGAAALLQLAHPFVAYGVAHHSETLRDPRARFRRTFAHVFAMIFGDLDHALASARRVHAIHERVTGEVEDRPPTRYEANEPEALAWVYATLVHGALDVYERVVARLTEDERDAYVDEQRRMARLFGIPDALLPRTYEQLVAYVDETVATTLRVTEPARRIAHAILAPPSRLLAVPSAAYVAATAALLPPRIREGFGLPYRRRERAAFRALVLGLRATVPLLPKEARFFPAYVAAEHRVGHAEGSPRVARWLHQRALDVALRRA
jgi:uncharacterized protein (DUF2236 family)